MTISLKNRFCIFFCGVFIFAACSKIDDADRPVDSQNNRTNAARQTVGDDVEELAKIVKLPLAPEEATYREENQTAAGGKKLTAVLMFSTSADAAQIVAQAEKYQPAAAAEIETEDWFPVELVAQSQLSGDETLKGVEYAAAGFFQTPYSEGKLTRVGETNYFVLELAAR